MKNLNLLAVSILNNPGLLALIVVACVIVLIGIIILIVKLPKIKEKVQLKKTQREEQKKQEAIKDEKGREFVSKALSEEKHKIENKKTSGEINDLIDIVQHKEKDLAVVEKKKSEKMVHKEAMVNDVIGIMQGGVSKASAYKKQEDFKTEEVKKQEEAKQKQAEKEVDFVLGVMGSKKDASKQTTNKSKSKKEVK